MSRQRTAGLRCGDAVAVERKLATAMMMNLKQPAPGRRPTENVASLL